MSDRHTVRCASYLILEKDGKILLMKRQNTGFRDGMYSLVAGHVDAKETFEHAMIREAKEEVGVEIDEGDIEPVQMMHRESDESAYVDTYFKATNWDGEVQNMEPEKCSELKWVSPDNLPENTIEYVKDAITERNQDGFYMEHGWQ